MSNLFCFPKVGLEFIGEKDSKKVDQLLAPLIARSFGSNSVSNLPPVVVPVLSHNGRSPGWRLGGGCAEREGMGRRGLVFNSLVVRWLPVGRKV